MRGYPPSPLSSPIKGEEQDSFSCFYLLYVPLPLRERVRVRGKCSRKAGEKMVRLGKFVLFNLFIVTLLSFPLAGEDTLSELVEDSSERQISSPGGGIVLRIEWNNPFNPEASNPDDRYTRIYYKVSEEGATIRIYSINGELVRTLAEDKTEMEDTIEWNGKNEKGEIVGSGVYLVNLKIGKSSKTVKVVVLK